MSAFAAEVKEIDVATMSDGRQVDEFQWDHAFNHTDLDDYEAFHTIAERLRGWLISSLLILGDRDGGPVNTWRIGHMIVRARAGVDKCTCPTCGHSMRREG